MSEGQKTMLVAIAYPNPARGKRSTSLMINEVNQGRLSKARAVLAESEVLAEAVIDGPVVLKLTPQQVLVQAPVLGGQGRPNKGSDTTFSGAKGRGVEFLAARINRLAASATEKLQQLLVFGTFEEYVEQRWGWDTSRATRLISAASAAEKIMPIGTIPASESHVRPLLKLEADADRAAVWAGSPRWPSDAVLAEAAEGTPFNLRRWVGLRGTHSAFQVPEVFPHPRVGSHQPHPLTAPPRPAQREHHRSHTRSVPTRCSPRLRARRPTTEGASPCLIPSPARSSSKTSKPPTPPNWSRGRS